MCPTVSVVPSVGRSRLQKCGTVSSMPRRKELVTLYIRQDQANLLREVRDTTGVNMSELVRRAIDAYLSPPEKTPIITEDND